MRSAACVSAATRAPRPRLVSSHSQRTNETCNGVRCTHHHDAMQHTMTDYLSITTDFTLLNCTVLPGGAGGKTNSPPPAPPPQSASSSSHFVSPRSRMSHRFRRASHSLKRPKIRALMMPVDLMLWLEQLERRLPLQWRLNAARLFMFACHCHFLTSGNDDHRVAL